MARKMLDEWDSSLMKYVMASTRKPLPVMAQPMERTKHDVRDGSGPGTDDLDNGERIRMGQEEELGLWVSMVRRMTVGLLLRSLIMLRVPMMVVVLMGVRVIIMVT